MHIITRLCGAALAAFGIASALPSPAAAQEVTIENEAAARANPELLLGAAAQLIDRGLLPQAGALIDKAVSFGVDANKARFQRARLAERAGNLEGAAAIYREMLLAEPDALRVRLELGRIYFLLQDDAKSELQFNYALAGDLPEPVVANVRNFLAQIKSRRRYAFDFDFAIAPDTNVNAATSQRQVELYDLPFQLDDNAREKSGVGIDVSTSGRYDVPVVPGLLVRQTASLRRVDYEGGNFDDTNLAYSVGPVLRQGNTEVTAAALLGRRWYSDDGYSYYYGLRGGWQSRVADRLDLALGVQAYNLKYDDAKRLDGPRFSISANPLYALSPQSLLRGAVTVDRELAETPSERSVGFYTGLGLFTELPYGFNVYAEPGIEFRVYDAKAGGFGKPRDSVTYSFEINFRNRQLDVYGFTPVIGTVLQKRDSKVDLYDFDRVRFTLGVSRQF
ncbi:MAG: DUF560 domain-containing protein [Geminicoccaceae bacterium]|nr:DUF560 domain-containing protein [Geminicoccaceae bacterium]